MQKKMQVNFEDILRYNFLNVHQKISARAVAVAHGNFYNRKDVETNSFYALNNKQAYFAYYDTAACISCGIRNWKTINRA